MLVVLDFETYYDKDYTLRKLSTSEYVRDKRFEALSCAVKLIAPGKLPTTVVLFGKKDIQKYLDNIDWPKATLLCHHTHFDGLILSHHFKKVPARYACTLSMARALHPKAERADLGTVGEHYGKLNKLPMPDFKGKHLKDITAEERKAIGEYNVRDVDVCYEVYQEMLKVFPADELDLVDVTVRMFADPVLRVDLDLAKKELRREQRAKRKAIKESGASLDVLSSNDKFVKMLESLGVDVPMKASPTVPGKAIPAVAKSDEGLQALLIHPDPKVVKLVEGRLAAKSTLGESRAIRMIARGSHGMRLPIYLNYAGAHTFRWSGGDKFNPQNFKQAQKEGGELRKAIKAPPGEVIVVVDSSQIEARITAWLSDEEWVVEAFRQKRDLYCEFASDAYERIITKADKEERFVGKTCVLGLGFGMGAPKLQWTILTQSINQGLTPVRLPLEVCYLLVDKYRKKCAKIRDFWKFANDRGIAAMISGEPLEHKCLRFVDGAVELPSGLRLLYPGIDANIVQKRSSMFQGTEEVVQDASYLTLNKRSKLYGGLLTENLVQALARIVVADVMRKLSKRYRIVMMTHDEIVFTAAKSKAKEALKYAMDLMAEPPSWAPTLPLASEGGYDVCYSK